jgi:glycosyltransferase involved in cell wall biosynthesis
LHPILVLIKGLGLGGAERLVVDSLHYRDQTRYAYHVAYLTPWKDALAPAIQAAGVPVYCLGGGRDGGKAGTSTVTPPSSLQAAWQLPRALRRLAALQRRERFDLIHADLPVAGVLARIVGKRYGVPVVYTEHNLQEHYHPVTRWANRATYGWNDVVVAVSEEVAASIGRNGMAERTRLVTLRNGVPVEAVRAEATGLAELRQELNLPPGRPIVGSVAVFRRQKRLDDWLATAKRVAEKRPDALFLLVGDGPEMPAVVAQVAALGLQERVRLPGLRPDGRRCMGLMDVYLMTSEYEGLPMALLEAMALGKPVVATAVGGIPEVVDPDKSGWLAQAGATGELARAVLALLDDEPARHAMGNAAAQAVEARFHLRQRVAAIEGLYAELLGMRKAGDDAHPG